jgi:uncharacterized membrane protein YtjA (UPF0391 family)
MRARQCHIQSGRSACEQELAVKVLHYAAICFVVAIIAAVFGVGGVATNAAEVAKALFFIFLIVAAVMLVLGLIAGREE